MSKPKLALIPATQGSKLYSVLPADGVGDFTFSRGSASLRINKDGLIETVASGVSRLNYPLIDGVVNGCPSHLLEPTKQNVLQRSEEFDNAYWVNGGTTINANQTISPSGELNADLLTGVSGTFGVLRFSTWTATNKVASCFVKKGSSNLFKIANFSGGNRYVIFNLSNGTVSEQSTGWTGFIENYGNGWYRCTAISNNETGTFSLGVTAASESVYIWGAQLESDYKTSYIPTTTSAVTRSAETANGAGDASTFNDSEGVLYAKISALSNSVDTYRLISLNNGSGTNTNRIFIGYTNNNSIYAAINNTTIAITASSFDVKNFNKVAVVYNGSIAKLFINGLEVGSGITNAPTLSGLSRVDFSGSSTGANEFKGNTKQLQYFDSALTDAELQALTSN